MQVFINIAPSSC